MGEDHRIILTLTRAHQQRMMKLFYSERVLLRRFLVRFPALIVFIVMFLSPLTVKAQILHDSAAINIITKGMYSIYNMDFEGAEEAYKKIASLYPDHPVLDLYSGMMIYWKNFPMIPSSGESLEFEDRMRRCIEKSENYPPPGNGYEAEYLLSNISARGLLLLFFADNDLSNNVIPLVTSSYRPLMKTFNYSSNYPDFYYFTGVYNYYRDAYPRVYPVYKTVAFLFPAGDLAKGLKQLEICGNESMALRAEAIVMLYWIRMNFEMDFKAALPFAEYLNNSYPNNPLYRVFYIKNLLLLKQYNKAENIISASPTRRNDEFYNGVSYIFRGIIAEKKYKDNVLASSYYKTGIGILGRFGSYTNEYAAYGYFGLSRIGEDSADKHERKVNHRKAMELADFKKINFDD